ncbi:hypothetical protein A9G13_10140 [Gilliamella sp. wkB178]|uniref:hypothetical protein n=1 Tax=Gilliamella sp. wkB178 TaxID=3120259 RepID=UPI00080DF97F|nr:hypothetical protein [Gilliamella apicola]OCG06615.1 hypothetical protein A9G13_10140 [Gilliamella apicola]
MIVIDYWQKLSKRFIIKTALSHLLLGVIATGFSLCSQDGLPAEASVPQVGIIAITAIVPEHQSVIPKQSQTLSRLQKQYVRIKDLSLNYSNISPSKIIRLSPYNGIRAGPQTIAQCV